VDERFLLYAGGATHEIDKKCGDTGQHGQNNEQQSQYASISGFAGLRGLVSETDRARERVLRDKRQHAAKKREN
jgi:hypothetical protein